MGIGTKRQSTEKSAANEIKMGIQSQIREGWHNRTLQIAFHRVRLLAARRNRLRARLFGDCALDEFSRSAGALCAAWTEN